MSTFVTSRRTRGQHVSPKFQSAPYRQSPARRQHIFGKVQGIPDRRDPTARLFIALALVVALIFAAQMLRGWK